MLVALGIAICSLLGLAKAPDYPLDERVQLVQLPLEPVKTMNHNPYLKGGWYKDSYGEWQIKQEDK